MILDQIVEKCASVKLRQKMLKKDMTLEEVEAIGTSMEESEKKLKDFEDVKVAEDVNRVSGKKMVNEPDRDLNARQKWIKRDNTQAYRSNQRNWNGKRSEPVCFACGRRGHVMGAAYCPAKQAACLNCKRIGHFARQCRKRPNRDPRSEPAAKRVRVVQDTGSEDNKESDYMFYAMGNNTFTFSVGGVEIPMVIDSGAAANIINQLTWMDMKRKGVVVRNMATEIDRALTCYGSEEPMEITGCFTATIAGGGHETEAQFYVAKRGQQCLLGDETAKSLYVLKIGFDVGRVSEEATIEFPKIKDVVVEIPVDRNVQPVRQAYRRVPYALEDKVEEKLDMLLTQGIIERVHEPSPWVSPLVPVLKDSGDVRLCIDMRRANKAVLREAHPLPLVDELLGSVDGATVFSKIDIKEAYHQMEISKESRPITTFITKTGLYRYERLMFGVSCAPEIFQKTMEAILAGLEGIIIYLDDIVVFGETRAEHDKRLQALLKRLEQYGVLLNEQKCVYGVTEIEFLGHVLNSEGVKPTENRVMAIKCFREPKNVSELRSFLGLVTYVGRFVSNLAGKTEPLRKLLRTGSIFRWKQEQNAAFQDIKAAVCNIGYLGFFNRGDRTKLVTDASPEGLGAVLLQENEKGETRIIAFASKALTDLERKYFQTRFQLITDCKALKYLFNPRSRPCPRIERWVLRLQAYDYEIIYEPGSSNLADSLSRLSVRSPKAFDISTDAYIRQLIEHSISDAVVLNDVIQATKNDTTLQELMQALETDVWPTSVKGYKQFKTELHTAAGVIMRGDRLVIPEILRSQVIVCAHDGHPGMTVMKRRLRQKVWWLKMDDQVDKYVKSCNLCTMVSTVGPPEPMQRTKMPTKAWSEVAIDFLGPLPNGYNLLVLIDYFSRFAEVIIMKQTTAELTAKALFETFSRFGIPDILRSDHGPQFISESMKRFCKEFGIQQQRTTPYWPQANGEVERMNNTILKRLRISQESQNADWRWDLRNFLLMYNSTPHTTTGVAPSVLMFGRILRDKLPSVTGRVDQMTEGIRDRDWSLKLQAAESTNKRKDAKENTLKVGDLVIAKRTMREYKLSSNFGSELFEVISRSGSEAKICSRSTGKTYNRNVSHLKPIVLETHDEPEADPVKQKEGTDNPLVKDTPQENEDQMPTEKNVEANLDFHRLSEQQKNLTEQLNANTQVIHQFTLHQSKPSIVNEGLEVLLTSIKNELSAINKNSSLAGSVTNDRISKSLESVTSGLAGDLRNINAEICQLNQLAIDAAATSTMTTNPILELNILDELKSLSAHIMTSQNPAPSPEPSDPYTNLEDEINNTDVWRLLGTRK
ncbi:uncharacterized protein K02A2.6-like, partial [Ochlerotatus camptorhynchus]|uniref:uncharacterized protein K02A2.6-like n=1 Tax=Ochlerotatus camptorhynchus TaxID=644619 RepID=UPI0031E33297